MDVIAENGNDSLLQAEQPRLPEDTQNRIGQQLRALYNQIAEEPVPDRLMRLLRELDIRERKDKKSRDG